MKLKSYLIYIYGQCTMCKNDFVCVWACRVCVRVRARERAVYENDYFDREILASVTPLVIDLVLGSIWFDRVGLRPGGIIRSSLQIFTPSSIHKWILLAFGRVLTWNWKPKQKSIFLASDKRCSCIISTDTTHTTYIQQLANANPAYWHLSKYVLLWARVIYRTSNWNYNLIVAPMMKRLIVIDIGIVDHFIFIIVIAHQHRWDTSVVFCHSRCIPYK